MTRTSIRALREQVFQFHTKLCNWPPEWHAVIIYPSSLFKKVKNSILTILICSDECRTASILPYLCLQKTEKSEGVLPVRKAHFCIHHINFDEINLEQMNTRGLVLVPDLT